MVNYIKGPKYNIVPFTKPLLAKWAFPLALWGVAAGAAVLTFAEAIPKVQRVFLQKIPVFGSYWVRTVPPEDSPQ